MITPRLTSIALAFALLAGIAGCGSDASGPQYGATTLEASVNAEEEPLTTAEIESLVFIREEEKLARDVYRALSGFGPIFTNIAASEQRHMDAVKVLLDRYGVADPAAGKADGAFADPSLQRLYRELVDSGRRSRLDALRVGAHIEELDLHDIEHLGTKVTHGDILTTYTQLTKGSRNHLRSFDAAIVAAGASYTPVHIDQATYDAIVSSPRETGRL